jgi:hypothetical protein
MKIEYAESVIDTVRENPGVSYNELSSRFPDEEGEQLYRLLYGLCALEKSLEGESLAILTKKEDPTISGHNIRGIERGEFTLNEDNLSEERLEAIFGYWKLN